MASTFTMFEKFGDVCAELNEEDRRQFVYALGMYGMFGEIVDLPYPLNAFLKSFMEDIDNSKKSRKKGAEGGRSSSSKDGKGGFEETTKGGSENDSSGVEQTDEPPLREKENHPCESSVTPLRENEQPNTNQTNTNQTSTGQNNGGRRFAPPTRDEVHAFAGENGLDRRGGFDADRFIDYYSAQGWRLSNGNPMKDWRAAARNWARRDIAEKGGAGDEYSRL